MRCQFCGADTAKVERPKEVKVNKGYVAPKSIWIWYTVICVYWAVTGAITLFAGIKDQASLLAIFGGLDLIIGLGMLMRLNIFRGIAHFLCWVNLLGGLCFIVGGLLGTMFFGPYAFISILYGIVDVVVAGLMIYVIAETESHFRA
jgi:hypothetical protein